MSDFDKAVTDSQKLTAKPSNEQLLELYGTHDEPPRVLLAQQVRRTRETLD